MRKHLVVLSSFAVLGCAQPGQQNGMGDYAAPAKRAGPQVVTREPADWAPLSSVRSIRMTSLRFTEVTTDRAGKRVGIDKDDRKMLQLHVFPPQKLVSFDAVPGGKGGLGCHERGQRFDLSFVASPGANVSDNLSCEGVSLSGRYRLEMSYRTTSRLIGDMLTIDGNAHVRTIGGDIEEDGNIEIYGRIQITGSTCRVIAWRLAHVSTHRFASDPSQPLIDHDTLEATPTTACNIS